MESCIRCIHQKEEMTRWDLEGKYFSILWGTRRRANADSDLDSAPVPVLRRVFYLQARGEKKNAVNVDRSHDQGSLTTYVMTSSAGKNDGTDFEYFCCASIRHVLLVFSICFVLFHSRCRYHDANDHEKSRADRSLSCSQDQAKMSSNVFCFAVEYTHDLHCK